MMPRFCVRSRVHPARSEEFPTVHSGAVGLLKNCLSRRRRQDRRLGHSLGLLLALLALPLCLLLGTSMSARAQGVSTGDGTWVWENPLPQGNNLEGVWASDASNVWAVGDAGTILKWNGSVWNGQSSGTTNLLVSIWGSDANNVWAVGIGGTILSLARNLSSRITCPRCA